MNKRDAARGKNLVPLQDLIYCIFVCGFGATTQGYGIVWSLSKTDQLYLGGILVRPEP